ncbi:MAG: pheS [Chlamydiales bacterium]|nr:pheS [Chlamydiales bacterium]
MNSHIQELADTFKNELTHVNSSKELEEIRVKYLGKKSPVQALMKHLKDLSEAERPLFGKQINDLKSLITTSIDQLAETVFQKELASQFEKESLDITLPGKGAYLGATHPVAYMLEEVIETLAGMGFAVQDGPNIESDYYNFEALNFAADHPARDMQDTFYLSEKMLLRTHTSNVQVRAMQQLKPPIRVISHGKCFRNEDISARSHVVFHQVEALYINKGVSFTDLVSTFEQFATRLFKQKVEVRIRPSYFPFVEPGLEIDIHCLLCSGKGCSVCKHSGWLEVAGAGMVHPNVLKSGGIDPEIYSGFAWGLGIERFVMILQGIKDIRLFMENDYRFLKQFSGI